MVTQAELNSMIKDLPNPKVYPSDVYMIKVMGEHRMITITFDKVLIFLGSGDYNNESNKVWLWTLKGIK